MVFLPSPRWGEGLGVRGEEAEECGDKHEGERSNPFMNADAGSGAEGCTGNEACSTSPPPNTTLCCRLTRASSRGKQPPS
jgi:hypothetical protein